MMVFPKHGSSLIMEPHNLTEPYSLTFFLILLKDDLNYASPLEEEFMPKKHFALPRRRRKEVVLTKTPRKELSSSIFFPAQESQECGMRSSFSLNSWCNYCTGKLFIKNQIFCQQTPRGMRPAS